MRIYGIKRIPADIRQKEDVVTKFGAKARPLTKDDFEIVPEHDEEILLEVRCEICGVMAEDFDGARHSSLLSIEINTWGKSIGAEWVALSGEAGVTDEFLGEDWYEVCEPCMRDIIAPYLNSLRRITPPSIPVAEPEEEPAVLPVGEVSSRYHAPSSGPLIGKDEEASLPAQLPPLSDDEPF